MRISSARGTPARSAARMIARPTLLATEMPQPELLLVALRRAGLRTDIEWP
jgi:hypothetical protein